MVSPLGCIFGIIIAALAFLFIIFLNILIKVKGFFSSLTGKGQQRQHTNTQHNKQTNNSSNTTNSTHQKVFDDNEGEYVEFEEIK